MPGSFEPNHPELLLPRMSGEKSRWFSDASSRNVENLITLLKIKLTKNQREQLLEGDYKNVHQWVMRRVIAAWKVTGPGLEPRPWNCTRCSTIELSGPPGYHNVTGSPIPSRVMLMHYCSEMSMIQSKSLSLSLDPITAINWLSFQNHTQKNTVIPWYRHCLSSS